MAGDPDVTIRRRVVVSGRVQGVFFRDSCREMARRLHVNGWVRNRNDGSVELAAEGPEAAVERLVDWCRKGPARAAVTHVDVSAEAPVGETSFRISH